MLKACAGPETLRTPPWCAMNEKRKPQQRVALILGPPPYKHSLSPENVKHLFENIPDVWGVHTENPAGLLGVPKWMAVSEYKRSPGGNSIPSVCIKHRSPDPFTYEFPVPQATCSATSTQCTHDPSRCVMGDFNGCCILLLDLIIHLASLGYTTVYTLGNVLADMREGSALEYICSCIDSGGTCVDGTGKCA